MIGFGLIAFVLAGCQDDGGTGTETDTAGATGGTSGVLQMLDAHRASRGEYERLGPEQTLAMYSLDEPSHFAPEGATRMAELTVRLACIQSEALRAQFLSLD